MARLSKQKLFSSLGYEPHEGQQLIHASKAKRRVVACGARWGKTHCAAMEALAAALEPREQSLGWVTAPTYDLAARVFRRMQVVVLEHLEHRVIELQERERWFKLLNMSGGVSEVRIKSADRPVGLLGEAVDWLVLDEAARISREVWESYLSPRLIDRDGWALLISTPNGPGWFHRAYLAGQKSRTPGCESWSAPSWQNPHIPAEAIEAERARLTQDAFAQEFGGEFLGVEDEPCDTCGYPDPAGCEVLILEAGDEIPLCPECKRVVEPGTHKTAVRKIPGYAPRVSIIQLHTDLGMPPELPSSVEAIIRDKQAQAAENGGDWDEFE